MSTVRAVYTNLKAARNAIKDLSRFRQISLVLVRHGFGHFVASFNVQDQEVSKALDQHLEGSPEIQDLKESGRDDSLHLFERIPEILQELGPTFVKLGQMIATNSYLFPDAYVRACVPL